MEYVYFPKIGIGIPVRRILFSPFGFPVYTYGVITAFALFLAVFLGLRKCEKCGISQDNIIDLMLFATPISIIFARLYYVIFSWDYFKDDFMKIINIREGGMAIYGAVIGALLTALVFTRIKKISTLNLMDFGVPYLLMAQGIGRWGNFVNQEVFGTNTNLPWGMISDEISRYITYNAPRLNELGILMDPLAPVHPTFLYESLWNLAVFAILLMLSKKKKFDGQILLGYLIGYGIGRAFIEGIRIDSLMLGSIRISQLLSVIFVIGGLIIYTILYRNSRNKIIAAASEIGQSAYGDIITMINEEDETPGTSGAGDGADHGAAEDGGIDTAGFREAAVQETAGSDILETPAPDMQENPVSETSVAEDEEEE